MATEQTTTRVLQIGAGRFGARHLETWKRLEAEGLVKVTGVVVATDHSRSQVERTYGVPAMTELTDRVLRTADAVDIVTPSATHAALVRRTLPFCHVLVEKPLATTSEEATAIEVEADRCPRVLMVNHLFRFHPVTTELRRLLAQDVLRNPGFVRGRFLNTLTPATEHYDINLELIHFFDLLSDLFGEHPIGSSTQVRGRVHEISLQYAGGMLASLELGWAGCTPVRTLEIHFEGGRTALANFADNTIDIIALESRRKIVLPAGGALDPAFRQFLKAVEGQTGTFPGADAGARAVQLAVSTMPGLRNSRPSVLVVGGGIFGVACAAELGTQCDVTLVERHPDLLTEASLNNQLRHHSGFHYPRSIDTVQEIQTCRPEFDAVYGTAILPIDSYFCTQNKAQLITAERYLAFCRGNRLNFTHQDPPAGLIDTNNVDMCLLTDEAVLDIDVLRETGRAQLTGNPRIDMRLGTNVISGRFTPAGRKEMEFSDASGRQRATFDYLINATYNNTNLLAHWFGFPIRRMRFDICEMLVLEIAMPESCITIIDGPFTSLMSMGRDNRYLFYQMGHGLLESQITADGLPPKWAPLRSNWKNMIRDSVRYLPILESAKVVDSCMGHRVVRADTDDFDGRPTVVTSHGFGCWSVLGGKIATAVTNARSIASTIVPVTADQRMESAAAVSHS